MPQYIHIIDCIYSLQTLQMGISNKDVPMGGLDEWPDIPLSMEFSSGWAKSLVDRICSREDFGFPR